MLSQQLTRADVIGVATLSVWAGGVVYLACTFGDRALGVPPGGSTSTGDLLTAAIVLVGLRLVIRELLVAPAAPPSKIMRRPILVVAAVAVTAVLLAAEAEDLGLRAEGVASAAQGLAPIGIAVVGWLAIQRATDAHGRSIEADGRLSAVSR